MVSAEVIAPAGAGALADRSTLWNSAEAAERRKDARTAREWVLALPTELDASQRKDLAHTFARELVSHYGVAVDVAIHEPSRQGDNRNHHAHLLCTTRKIEAGVLTDKAEIELSDTKRKQLGLGPGADEIKNLRKRWEVLANRALARAGQQVWIDHRSLVVQKHAALSGGNLRRALELDRPAQIHVGINAAALDRRAGYAKSGRGLAREAAQSAAAHAADSADRRARAAISVEMNRAAAALGVAIDPVRAHQRPPENESRAVEGPGRALERPATQPPTPTRAPERPSRADDGPHEEITMSDTSSGAGQAFAPEATEPKEWQAMTMAEIRKEIERAEAPLDDRLDAAIPGRGELRRLQGEERARADREHVERSKAAQHRKEWDSAPAGNEWILRVLNALGIPVGVAGKQQQAEQEKAIEQRLAQLAADPAKLARIESLRAYVRPLEKKLEPVLKGKIEEDKKTLEELDARLSEWESFEAGRFGRGPGPAHSFQIAYDRVTGRQGPSRRAPPAEALNWAEIVTRGAAGALLAGNTSADVAEVFVGRFGMAEAQAADFSRQGEAQAVVQRVRGALEDKREPVTEAGMLMAGIIAKFGDDEAAARRVILDTLPAARQALALDPAFREGGNDAPALALR